MKQLILLVLLMGYGSIATLQAQEKLSPQLNEQSAPEGNNTSKKLIINCKCSNSAPPLYLMKTKSGELALTKDQISFLKPSWIKGIVVMKGKEAVEKYETAGDNGIVLITLKPENQNEALQLLKAAQ